MRTIKFRGYSIKEERFIYGDLLTFENCFGISETEGERNFYIVETNSIGQFTGLYDKNGKEIYEGDIITVYDKKAPIVFDQEYCSFFIKIREGCPDENTYSLSNENIEDLKAEVIGNIYDNPELLQ